ncbi:Spherulation-specific family 4-domain-containing protein [Mycena crocata]|nr:Spherulation-specific family 4-domain-containing protein [Mycena crocata]
MLPSRTQLLVIQFLVTPCIHGLGVLLPLYIYPDADCAAWAPVSNAISAHPKTQFYVIINPDNGPGSVDLIYQECVSGLPSSENQIVLGYIDTTSGNVLGDIDTYVGWPSPSRPTGIFFDNVSPTVGQLRTYQGYMSYAKSQGFTFTALDPGQTAAASYFQIADMINTYEDSYSVFDAATLSGPMSKQSVTLVNAPNTGSYSSVISKLGSLGISAVYITNVKDSSEDFPLQLSQFVDEVASLGGVCCFSGSITTKETAAHLVWYKCYAGATYRIHFFFRYHLD